MHYVDSREALRSGVGDAAETVTSHLTSSGVNLGFCACVANKSGPPPGSQFTSTDVYQYLVSTRPLLAHS